MKKFKRILVPVDLSKRCLPAVEFATQLAKSHKAEIYFCFVALPPLPNEASFYQGEHERAILKDHADFNQIQPSDLSVEYRHVFVRGNPGPEIVRLVDSKECDVVVMATHGRTGLIRWVLGSVAEYVIRHCNVPVITMKTPENQLEGESHSSVEVSTNKDSETEESLQENNSVSPFVTSAMSHAVPIHEFDEMSEVIAELNMARSTAAPVVDGLGKCIGILTNSDIEMYLGLRRRLEDKDESVLDEVFDVDKYGMRDLNRGAFHKVKKHMTSPVITISNMATCRDAEKRFDENKGIHHLVVVDEFEKPVGIVEPKQLSPLIQWDLEDEISI